MWTSSRLKGVTGEEIWSLLGSDCLALWMSIILKLLQIFDSIERVVGGMHGKLVAPGRSRARVLNEI